MTKRQIEWAKQHDWFRVAGRTTVYVYDSVKDDIVLFDDYQALRAWAGY